MGIALWPLAKVFEAGARTRAYLYRTGRAKQARLGRPVVSIGNLSMGGTGKTPFTIWLFEQLRRRGLRPAVLTRGYGRLPGPPTLILRGTEGELDLGSPPTAEGVSLLEATRATTAHIRAGLIRRVINEEIRSGGDEVQVMRRHGVAPIGVDANRFRAGRLLESGDNPPDLFLLDDGFQHLELARNLDIVLIDTTRPPWEDRLLPAGRLREPMSALARAQFVVLTRVQQWTDYEYARARVKLAAPRAEVLAARTSIWLPPPQPVPGLAFAFAGIGNPKAFFADLCVPGLKVIGTRAFGDHHRYTARDLRDLERRAAAIGATELVTTEKDAVNIAPKLARSLAMPLRVARMELEVEGGEALLERIEELGGGFQQCGTEPRPE